MNGFEVDVVEVRRAGGTVRELGESLASTTSLKYSMAPGQAGNEELAQALAEFHEASRHSTGDLGATAAGAATRLADTARDYERRDRSVADALITEPVPDVR